MSFSFKALLLTMCLALLPLAFGYWVNATARHAPTDARVAGRCTRYCEQHGCPHATAANSPAFFRLKPLYVATIKFLAMGGMGLYAAANIAFYVLLIPALLLWLTYGALRNMSTIRRLKQQPRS
ncbi:hypothetical protein GCM10023185_02720 [Hymenobacter saemangeumensis]|uniref:DUF2752 domain-containing protein n=1 Tax=Hymenobacter saemangeumensis TaxID=1084522 RepID=A0ABP8HYH0_9BACT